MAKYLKQIIILGARAMGRAFVKTVRQEFDAFQEAARIQRAISNASSFGGGVDGSDMLVKGMTLSEARQILNVKDLGDLKAIDTHYQHLFRANEKLAGGTFYLQSKVYRAKERIDQELTKLAAKAVASKSEPPAPASSASPSVSPSQSPAEAQFQAKKPDQKSR